MVERDLLRWKKSFHANLHAIFLSKNSRISARKTENTTEFTFFELIVVTEHKQKPIFQFLSLLMHERWTLLILIENWGVKDVRKIASKEEIEYGAEKMCHRIFRKIPCSGIFSWYSG